FNPATNSLNYNVFTHPFIHPGKLNRLSVEAYNKEGYSVYNTRSFAFFSDKKAEDVLPDLHVVVIGVSDYKGKALDLTYAAKDAADFSVALKLASEKYLGYRNTFIHTLITSDTSKRTHPSKENIKKAFSDVARQARPNDVVVIYMAGHGLNSDIDNDFHFLTDDAEHPYISSAEELAKITISTTELSRILQSIPAYQQLLILDACHSGSLATGLFSSAGQLDSESIRALEEVKDRTGVYVLASSEKEDYSYESHAFEQGLLTYSLLFGIKGAGLLDGEYVDVVKLLQFVHKNVPDLAGDIGEHQQPVLRIPNNANSFFLGRMLTEEREKINLVAPKPIITPSNFQSEASMFDDLAFSSLMDETIRKKKEEGNHFLFLESGSQFQNALSVYGRYSVGNNGVILCKYKIFKNQKEIYRGEISSSDKRAVAASIAQELMKKL
ncbi:MAG: caspase family protein, partial [Cyclobacteriaceae bacterium]|nr:caspase family protein [Cyclobacteriaceae bacterium]